MDYFHKIRSTVTQVAAQVSNALPGNPLTREYEVLEQIGSAGPGLFWKIYNGRKKTSDQPVAIWLFEKREMEKWSKEDKEEFVALLKRGVSQLTRLRHPRLLTVDHGIEESRDSLAFATEPVFASLANCLGMRENMNGEPAHLSDFTLLDVEIKHGLLQVAEALAFLHIDARMLHRNVCPETVIINDKGAWKLAGFDFAIQGTPTNNNQVSFDTLDYNEGKMAVMQPSLDFLAPEYILGGRAYSFADIFSLGITTFTLFNRGKPPVLHKGSVTNLKKNAEKLKHVPEAYMTGIPFVFRDDYKMCLNYTPDLRPDATQFTRIAFFDDALVKTLNYFESLMQMDNNQKMNFFKSLPQVLPKFEKRLLLQKVFPFLSGEFGTPDLIPFILPSVFLITEQASQKEFTACILPSLIPVFSMQRPYQIVLLLLQRMELLLAKASDDDVKKHILPLIYSAIGSETTRIQELCLSFVPSIGRMVDRQSMKTQLLPKLLKLAMEAGVLAVRVQALVCLGQLLPTLESWMVTEQVLPALPKINSKEPGMLMAILGIYKLSFEKSSIGVSREQLARNALPFLMAASIENTLNLGQFEQFISLIKAMMEKVEREQRSRLQQLSSGQEEQRNVASFESVLSSSTASADGKKKDISSDLADLMGSASLSAKGGAASKPSSSGSGSLSLEEKKRLAAEQARGGNSALPPAQPGLSPSNGGGQSPLAGPPKCAAASAPSMPSSSSFPSLDPFSSLLAPTVTASVGGKTVDVSDFMPNTSSSRSGALASPASSAFPTTLAGSSTPSFAAPSPSGMMTSSSSSNPLFLPQPPRSSNAPIQRPLNAPQAGNPLDSLFSFPNMGAAPSVNSLARPQSAAGATSLQPQKKDPFADLLG